MISNNTAIKGGGVYHFFWSSFSLSDGVISNNTAEIGGGVCMDNDLRVFQKGLPIKFQISSREPLT